MSRTGAGTIVARVFRGIGWTFVALLELTLFWLTSGGFGCFAYAGYSANGRRRTKWLIAIAGSALATVAGMYGDSTQGAAAVAGVAVFLVAYLAAVDVYLRVNGSGEEAERARARRRARRELGT